MSFLASWYIVTFCFILKQHDYVKLNFKDNAQINYFWQWLNISIVRLLFLCFKVYHLLWPSVPKTVISPVLIYKKNISPLTNNNESISSNVWILKLGKVRITTRYLGNDISYCKNVFNFFLWVLLPGLHGSNGQH